jgi:hypothetical protein
MCPHVGERGCRARGVGVVCNKQPPVLPALPYPHDRQCVKGLSAQIEIRAMDRLRVVSNFSVDGWVKVSLGKWCVCSSFVHLISPCLRWNPSTGFHFPELSLLLIYNNKLTLVSVLSATCALYYKSLRTTGFGLLAPGLSRVQYLFGVINLCDMMCNLSWYSYSE